MGNRDKRVFTWETVTNDFYVSSSFCHVFFHVHVYVQAHRWQSKLFFEILCGKTAIPSTYDVICDINSTSHRILHTPVRYTDWSCCCGFRTTGMGVQRFCRHYSRRQWTLICIEYASRRCAVKSNFLKLAESSPPMTKPKQNRLQHQQQDKKHEVTGFRHWFCWAEKKIY